MKKQLFIFVLVIFGTFRQTYSKEDTSPKDTTNSDDRFGFICTNPIRILYDEFTVFYFQQLTNRYTQGISLGYKRDMQALQMRILMLNLSLRTIISILK